MKKRHIPGVINIFEVNDPLEIKVLAEDAAIDRRFETPTCPFNWLVLKRSLTVLSFKGHRFPTMGPRDCPVRARAQEELWRELDGQVEQIKAGPDSLAPIAKWVAGFGSDASIGILTQQLLGSLFRSNFHATAETWAAALTLVRAPRTWNVPKLFWWLVTGRVRRAKDILAEQVNGDLSAVNAIGIAAHNVVKGLHHMRSLYADLDSKRSLAPEAAACQCLAAPLSVYRQSTARGKVLGNEFTKHALFILNIAAASKLDGRHSLVFMEDSWSQCPAASWVPAMLEGVWRRAVSNTPQSQESKKEK